MASGLSRMTGTHAIIAVSTMNDDSLVSACPRDPSCCSDGLEASECRSHRSAHFIADVIARELTRAAHRTSDDPQRDRFILSKGAHSDGVYAALRATV